MIQCFQAFSEPILCLLGIAVLATDELVVAAGVASVVTATDVATVVANDDALGVVSAVVTTASTDSEGLSTFEPHFSSPRRRSHR